MNIICENCLNLKSCKGKSGIFCFCYHNEDIIMPFSTFDDLYKEPFKGRIKFNTLYLKLYNKEDNLLLLIGHYLPDDGEEHLIGFVTF